MENVSLVASNCRILRDRIRALDPNVDEQTLSDTVEGLTNLNEILAVVVRAALVDEAQASGLRALIGALETRLERLDYRAAKRREMVRDAMVESEIKKIAAPDFTLVIRSGSPALVVTDEGAIPTEFWLPREPRLDRQCLLTRLKLGVEVSGAQLSNPQPVLSVRIK
jgi:hypothetical protein